jgi:multimeric flavodoxin WrbA
VKKSEGEKKIADALERAAKAQETAGVNGSVIPSGDKKVKSCRGDSRTTQYCSSVIPSGDKKGQ